MNKVMWSDEMDMPFLVYCRVIYVCLTFGQIPHQIKSLYSIKCVGVAAARDHTVFLSDGFVNSDFVNSDVEVSIDTIKTIV